MNSRDEPTFISLFSGCGGSSWGYQMAGYRELLAVEWNDDAVMTFRLNFPEVPVHHGDIKLLSVAQCLQLADVQPGELDVLDGSPPCQGFSTEGKNRLSDSRNQLFQEYCRLLQGLQPKAFIMENVPGMIRGKNRLIAKVIFKELVACGYHVRMQVMNAMYFDVPQCRQRLIFVGTRHDLGVLPSHPRALSRPRTVAEALHGVPADPTAFIVGKHTRIFQAMKSVPAGQRRPGHHSHLRLPLHRPSPTLMAGLIGGIYHYWHPTEHRTLTFNEAKRLTSFPDHFQLVGSPSARWQQIGNSVPPLFMKAIALHVKDEILFRC